MASLLPPNFFDALATVYRGPTGANAAFSDPLVLRTAVPCRLVNLSGPDPRVSPERAVLAAAPALVWDAAYPLPSDAAGVRITAHPDSTLAGSTWNVNRATVSAPADWTNTVTYRRAEITRAGRA
jgi:hypothetical protein